MSEARYIHELHARVLQNDPAAKAELNDIATLASAESFADQAKRFGTLTEYQFHSSLPVVGKLVSTLRSAVNSLATRWVVQALIQQQSRFNHATAQALAEMVILNRRLQSRLDALETRVADLDRAKQPH